MSSVGAQPSGGGADDHTWVEELQRELARVKSELGFTNGEVHSEPSAANGEVHSELGAVNGEVQSELRAPDGEVPSTDVGEPANPLLFDLQAVVDAISVRVTATLEQRIPALIEEAVRRVIPDAVEIAVPSLAEAVRETLAERDAATVHEREFEPDEPVFVPRGLGRVRQQADLFDS